MPDAVLVELLVVLYDVVCEVDSQQVPARIDGGEGGPPPEGMSRVVGLVVIQQPHIPLRAELHFLAAYF